MGEIFAEWAYFKGRQDHMAPQSSSASVVFWVKFPQERDRVFDLKRYLINKCKRDHLHVEQKRNKLTVHFHRRTFCFLLLLLLFP